MKLNFQKKYIYIIERGCNKSWVFETVRGATLIGNDTKALSRNMSRTECQQNCLNESDFDCRSVKFKVSSAGNETVGVCTLSNSDRHLMPTAYRVSTFDDYYLENQCTKMQDNPTRGMLKARKFTGRPHKVLL